MSVVVRWFPQSWVQIRADHHLVYIDPSNVNSMRDIVASAFSSKVRREELPEHTEPGDLVLVSHHHLDHVKKGLMDVLSAPRSVVLGPIKCRKKLGEAMRIVKARETITQGDLVVRVVEAYNPPGSRKMMYHKKGEGVGYVIEVDGKRIYHAGDTGFIDEMDSLGPIDVAFLPIGGKFTMDINEAAQAVKVIKPMVVIPMHMMRSDPMELKSLVENATSSKVVVLAPGEQFKLD
jgi:L-ascorbate metabolism protein UlaG (beta-lactamase superfamily)